MQPDLVLQLKYYMIGSSLLTVARLACIFRASLALNENCYQKPWVKWIFHHQVVIHHTEDSPDTVVEGGYLPE